LIVFLGIAAAIVTGVAFALKDGSVYTELTSSSEINISNPFETTVDTETGESDSLKHHTALITIGSDQVVPSEQIAHIGTSSSVPIFSLSPPPSLIEPCIPLEIGIIFDAKVNETGWKMIEGANEKNGMELINSVVWQSKFYDSKCTAPMQG